MLDKLPLFFLKNFKKLKREKNKKSQKSSCDIFAKTCDFSLRDSMRRGGRRSSPLRTKNKGSKGQRPRTEKFRRKRCLRTCGLLFFVLFLLPCGMSSCDGTGVCLTKRRELSCPRRCVWFSRYFIYERFLLEDVVNSQHSYGVSVGVASELAAYVCPV